MTIRESKHDIVVALDRAANPGTDGFRYVNSAGSGIRIRQELAANIVTITPIGAVNLIQYLNCFISSDFGIVSGPDGTGNIGSSTARFNQVFPRQIRLRDHSAFTGSEAISATGAVQTTAAGASNIFSVATLADNSATMVTVEVIGRDTGGADRAFAVRRASISRNAGGAATLVIATQTIGTDSLPAGYAVDIVASGNGFNVTVATGAAVTCNWVATVRYQTVSGNT